MSLKHLICASKFVETSMLTSYVKKLSCFYKWWPWNLQWRVTHKLFTVWCKHLCSQVQYTFPSTTDVSTCYLLILDGHSDFLKETNRPAADISAAAVIPPKRMTLHPTQVCRDYSLHIHLHILKFWHFSIPLVHFFWTQLGAVSPRKFNPQYSTSNNKKNVTTHNIT